MTQLELAQKLGTSPQSVSSWINAKKSARMDKVDMMCQIFGCSRSDLIDERTGTEPPQSSPSPEEEQLLEHFNQLNRTGREKVLEDVESMTYNPRYKRGESSKEA
jgi:transcriptional regulator with XRE-family HTH domain